MSKLNKKNKEKKPKSGICALLAKEGLYAKSHLIPAALTRPDQKGAHFIEAGRGMRPIRRPSSWYDDALCSREGELILSEIDNFGISILRHHQLVWGSWPPKKQTIQFRDYLTPDSPDAQLFRQFPISVDDAKRLKLFYLSILWRFLRSNRAEFSYLENIGVDLDELAAHIRSRTAPDRGHYLMCLHQLTTRGFTHNHGPTIQEMDVEVDGATVTVRFYRIYFDGLVAHLYARSEPALPHFGTEASIYVGEADDLLVFTRPFENSFQLAGAEEAMKESFSLWPTHSARLMT